MGLRTNRFCLKPPYSRLKRKIQVKLKLLNNPGRDDHGTGRTDSLPSEEGGVVTAAVVFDESLVPETRG